MNADPPYRYRGWYEGWSWQEGDVERYNAAARELMEAEGIPIDDLYALIASDLDTFMAEDNLHLSDEGMRAAARSVVACVRHFGAAAAW